QFAGSTLNASFNLVGDAAGTQSLSPAQPDVNGNLIGGGVNGVLDPELAPLTLLTSNLPFHRLLGNSPAINAGNPTAQTNAAFDQRGLPFQRIIGGRIDIGAFEFNPPIDPSSLVVSTTVDESDGNFGLGDLSLREAVELSNSFAGTSSISFDSSLSGSTIVLTMGQLEIRDDVTISAAGLNQITVDASGNDPTPANDNGDGSRVFLIDDGSPLMNKFVEIDNLRIIGGDSSQLGGGIASYEDLHLRNSVVASNATTASSAGIAILVTGSSSLTNVEISDNHVSGNSCCGGMSAYVGPAATLTMTNVEITGNTSQRSDGGIQLFNTGGNVTIQNLLLDANETTDFGSNRGGGSFFSTEGGQVRIEASTISNNTSARRAGGAALVAGGGEISLVDSEVSGNVAGKSGGGLYLVSDSGTGVVVQRTTVTGNQAEYGAGVYINTDSTGIAAVIENSTISYNDATYRGGGIGVIGTSALLATISHSTIVNNTSVLGTGGIANFEIGDVAIENSIVARNQQGTSGSADVSPGVVPSFSLIGNNHGSPLTEAPKSSPDANGNMIGGPIFGEIDPRLGPLRDNGGPTPTHLPGKLSPVRNAGDPEITGAPATDQRGLDRIVGNRVDMGAVESVPVFPKVVFAASREDGQ
ncbi:MAG: choice-of-anchor Q domain-containing protein, partial [Planctomycetota bacterium]